MSRKDSRSNVHEAMLDVIRSKISAQVSGYHQEGIHPLAVSASLTGQLGSSQDCLVFLLHGKRTLHTIHIDGATGNVDRGHGDVCKYYISPGYNGAFYGRC